MSIKVAIVHAIVKSVYFKCDGFVMKNFLSKLFMLCGRYGFCHPLIAICLSRWNIPYFTVYILQTILYIIIFVPGVNVEMSNEIRIEQDIDFLSALNATCVIRNFLFKLFAILCGRYGFCHPLIVICLSRWKIPYFTFCKPFFIFFVPGVNVEMCNEIRIGQDIDFPSALNAN